MKIKKEIKHDQLNITLSFNHDINNVKEYSLVTLCSICAYFMQKKIDVKTDGLKNIYIGDVIIGDVDVLKEDIHVVLYMNEIKKVSKAVNPTLIFIGLQTYFNIYFNLYDTHEYKQIEDFYLKVKKGA